MRKLISFIFLIVCVTQLTVAQSTIQGTVTNAKTGEPISDANVYLSGTTIGASTGDDGEYEITTSETGSYNLVFSFVGYKEKVVNVELQQSTNTLTRNASLKKSVEKLDRIEVETTNEKWKKRYEVFVNQFIGIGPMAEEVSIKNPWVIHFEEKGGNLIAKANKPIIIINNALGYKLRVELKKFNWPFYRNHGGSYKIYSRYEKLTTKDENQRHDWIKNRLKSYLGSSRHFLKSLYHEKIHETNFSVKKPYFLSNLSQGETKYKLLSVSGISPERRNRLKGYELTRKIEISFDDNAHYTFNGERHSISVEKHAAIRANRKNNLFYVDQNGMLLNPLSLKMYENWAHERVAKTLPTNFDLD